MGVRENLQRWREDYAREVGMEQRAAGRSEGRAEGQRTLLEKQLRLKFGSLPPSAAERLARADAVSLDLWAGAGAGRRLARRDLALAGSTDRWLRRVE